ncbi:diadenylate cyclase [Mycoplasmopsis felis]|uniref:diadenylate cyclase n=1 Tax=Mycoplasmopsis felis TaxID=33923 RepID=UPI0039C6B34D
MTLILFFVFLNWTNIHSFIVSKIKKNKYDKIGKSSQIRLINQLRESVEYLSKTKTGALITIENNDNLDNLRTDGIIVNANISSALLISIFNKYSPLHDGAVIIRDAKIYYASTFYKITSKSVNSEYGSRHRAAIGISEQSDAITIIVSEETGTVRILKKSKIHKVKLEEFQEELIKFLKD